VFVREPSSDQIRALRAPLREAASELRAMALSERARLLENATGLLLDTTSELGRALRAALLERSGLSPPVIEHGLSTTLALFEAQALVRLHATREPSPRAAPPAELVTVVLAGNVFSAAARPLLLPLLCGHAVLAKASSRDDALPRHLALALEATDRRLGAACAVLSFAGGDEARQAALLEDAALLSAYGSDETVAEIAARMKTGARLLPHGHGVGAIALCAAALCDRAVAEEVAARVALDVAAYDQHGCLSPHTVFVERGGAVAGGAFARVLLEDLEALAVRWPRGPLDAEAAASALQWRGVAAATGTLYQGRSAAVSFRGDAPFCASPGFRHVSVCEHADGAELRARLRPLGLQLKALGVAGAQARAELGSLAPYVCEVGAMQTPPLDAPLDGLHPLAGLVG
jgi:hypothetical protein